MIRFNCPKCSKAIAVKDEYAGKKGMCSGCSSTVAIPQPAGESAVYAMAATPAASAKPAPAVEYAVEDDAADSDDDLPPAPPPMNILRRTPRRDAENVPDRSSVQLQMWLRFYARVNLVLSAVICSPLFLIGIISLVFGVFAMFASAGAAGSSEVGMKGAALGGAMFSGMAIVWAVVELAASALVFMFMNVFTLACFWGAEVLRLLEE